MLTFESLKWKNFLSTGNNFTEINLREFKTNLIVGHNGAGKSTMLDALSFALFGKAHRNISKAQLVNSINNKNCEVQVEFTVSGSCFKIVRGIKPNIFEIWKNGFVINQDSHAKEYQRILEQNIIKLNHKSFHQIVVLGSSSFIPFMQLSAANRREVIEDLLDIGVFSKMNLLIKGKISALKEEIDAINYQILVTTNQIDTQKKYIADINKINLGVRTQKEENINAIRLEITELNNINAELSRSYLEQITIAEPRLEGANTKRGQLTSYKTQFTVDIGHVVKDAKFFKANDTCPVCTQLIDDTMKKDKIDTATGKAKELQLALNKLELELVAADIELDNAHKEIESIRNSQFKLNANNQTISRLGKSISQLTDEIGNLTDTTSDITQAQTDLEKYINNKEDLIETRLTHSDQYSYNQVIAEMLKDTGIKTKIVKQYLPVINKLVNQYLQVLDFFVSFDLDESFTETIRSRHRDTFSYDSFSEGEKQRIDLALLFTWRMIAKMKNSVATNLLILDETFDSSLDYEGVDNLMKIIYTLGDDTNVYVISHKGDILDGKFANKLEFFKEKNFSKVKG